MNDVKTQQREEGRERRETECGRKKKGTLA